MHVSPVLIDELYRERDLRAREMPPEEKLLAGGRLFDRSCRVMADGIRDEFPDADEAQVWQKVRERLALVQRIKSGD